MKERAPDHIPPGHLQRLPDYVPGSSQGIEISVPSAAPEVSILSTVSTEQAKKAEQETVKLQGRVGFAPKFDVLASGGARARFTIAEHTDEDTTLWHQVYSTKRFAVNINKAGLERGQLVEVAGRWQTQEQKQDDGTVKEVKRFYAFGVRILGGQKP